MKKLIILFSLLLISVEACAQKEISWKTNGKVTIGSHTLKLKMQNIYYGYKFDNGVYLIGFEIDKKGNNIPTLAWLSAIDTAPEYWTFNNVLQEIFILNGQVHLLDMNGEIQQLENKTWKKSAIKLKINSRVIDTRNGILACYPSPLFKSPPAIGGCYTANGKWEIKINWRDTAPKICKGYLIVVDQIKNILWLKKHNITNGLLLASKEIEDTPKDLCSVDFP